MSKYEFVTIISIALVALLIFFAVSYFKKRRDLRERGIRASAILTNHINTERSKKASTYTYAIEYIVKDERQTATIKTRSRREIGETVEVAYLPEDPNQVMLAEDFAEDFAED
ncbi:MAG: DUF3592 domain-containing protein [Synergistaceae bacterium]|nr:DUF3592 domain-containing protein [Synergistaceae bacterium]